MNDQISGKAKGGIARADKLSAEQRKEIAISGARARWGKLEQPNENGVKRALFGSPDKLLKIGNALVECYVLDGGTRVLSGRGMQEAIGLGGTPSSHGTKLRAFLVNDAIKPFVNKELAMAMESPMRFIRPGRGGVPAIAFEATLLIDLCESIISAYNADKLRKNYFYLMLQAQAITLSFAKAGIISAIDEVTGYQLVREHDEIQKILDKYLTDYAQKWSKNFPDIFWEKLLRAKGYESYIGLPRRSFVGHWVNDVVYSRLAPGVLDRLRTLNPAISGKGRKYKHTQFLTDDQGVPELKDHIVKSMTIMDVAIATGQSFDMLLQATIPKCGETRQLPLVVEND